MNEFKSSKVIEFYENLEEDFLAFLKVVPFEDQNKDTWSPKLVDILIGTGSILDSLFRMSMPENHNGKNREKLDMNDFNQIFARELEPLKSLVYVAPPFFLRPYENWSTAQAPSWWTSYNKVKHDRLENMHLATSVTTLNALCGLFEAIALNQKMGKALVRHEWTNFGSYNPDFLVPKLDTKKFSEVLEEGRTLLIESSLFVTTIGPESFPDEIKDIKPAFYMGTNKRLIAYLGKWMYDLEELQ